MSEQQLARILDPAYLDGLDDLSTAEVRQLRAECEDAEEGVSYARRLLQGRLDILRAELLRRESDGDDAAGPVLADLAAILAQDQPDGGGDSMPARATRLRVPPSAEHHEQQLDDIVDEADLAGLERVEVEELAALVERLTEHEHRLSGLRRELFDRIDALRDELARRYKDGRADVSQLLNDQQA